MPSTADRPVVTEWLTRAPPRTAASSDSARPASQAAVNASSPNAPRIALRSAQIGDSGEPSPEPVRRHVSGGGGAEECGGVLEFTRTHQTLPSPRRPWATWSRSSRRELGKSIPVMNGRLRQVAAIPQGVGEIEGRQRRAPPSPTSRNSDRLSSSSAAARAGRLGDDWPRQTNQRAGGAPAVAGVAIEAEALREELAGAVKIPSIEGDAAQIVQRTRDLGATPARRRKQDFPDRAVPLGRDRRVRGPRCRDR